MLAIAATVICGCSHQSSNSDAGGTAGLESTTVAIPVSATPRPNSSTGCENFPTQTVPPPADQDEIAELIVNPWPEGPIAHFGQPGVSYPAAWTTAFEKAKASIALPLPAAVENGCCSAPGNYVLVIRFTSGADAVYGPCALPGDLAAITSTLYVAAI